MTENYKHTTVLLDEAVNGLNIRPDGIYIDGTFGRGGHSRLILSQLGEEGRLLAIDRDPQAIAVAKTITDPRFSIVHGPFSALADYVAERGLTGKIDGILLDLGVSSPQLDDAERGFSFMREQSRGPQVPAGIPMTEAQIKKLGGRELRALGKMMPGEEEVAENPRARSSVLRIAERTNA